MRLQKFLSSAGICSRRAAEELILNGSVTVNGHVARLGDGCDPDSDEICVNGTPVELGTDQTYIMLNKPKGVVTTLSDEEGRATVIDFLIDLKKRVYPVGRLDYMSEGLLILTDDGELANKLMHPSSNVKKTYRVVVNGKNIPQAAERMVLPIDYKGVHYNGADSVEYERVGGKSILTVVLHEGKNREIRNMCAFCGLSVSQLQRISYAGLSLGNLAAGKWRHLSAVEIEMLKNI